MLTLCAWSLSCVNSEPRPELAAIDKAQDDLRNRAVNSPIKQPFLWIVERGDAKSYLFGSMHIGIEPEKDLPLLVWKAFWGARVFVAEVDFRKKRDPRSGWAPSKTNLRRELSSEAWQRLRRVLGGVDEDDLALMPPTIASFLYEWNLIMRRVHLPTNTVLDAALFSAAIKAGKETSHLDDEAILASPNLFGEVAHEVSDLEQILTTREEELVSRGRSQLYETLLAYKLGDLDAISYVWSEMADEARYEGLIASRNRVWMQRLVPILQGGGAFVTVGIGHMIGGASLIQLLREAGFSVTLVTF